MNAGTIPQPGDIDLSTDRKKLQRMEVFVLIFGVVLVALSMAGYFINGACKQISDLISQQNTLAEKIGLSISHESYFGNDNSPAPPELLLDVIEFSRTNATLLYTVDRISPAQWRTPLLQQVSDLPPTDGSGAKPTGTATGAKSTDTATGFHFKGFTVSPEIHTVGDLLAASIYQIRLYQAIRDSAQAVSNTWHRSIEVGTAYVLPVLYAVLGAFLFTFRTWCNEHRLTTSANPPRDETGRRTTNPQWPDHISRLLMAGIAGIAIGGLNELFPKEILLSPLALAFLVGYSIEVFISRLDGMIKNISKEKPQLTAEAGHAD
jgi:hypothetical protein